MRNVILEDAENKPQLFYWNGPVDEKALSKWLKERGLELPKELIELWKATGGGDMFETETILGPFADDKRADDVDSVNAYHRSQGMPGTYLIFHKGRGGLTTVRLTDGKIVALDEGYHEKKTYPSIADWYEHVIRSTYADRYGIEREKAVETRT